MGMVGKPAAAFRMASTKDLNSLSQDVTLADYEGRWLVLFFYPADFSFVCPSEVLAFSAAVPAFRALDADVLGVSTDGVYSHQAWCEFVLGTLDFPLASDPTHRVSRAFGVLLEDEGVAQRALFVIDPAGIVRYEVVHDESVGRSVDEVLRVVSALQAPGHKPAGWTPPVAAVAG